MTYFTSLIIIQEAQDNAPPTEHNVPSRQSELANPRDRPPKRVKSSAPKPRSKRSSKGDSSTRKRQKLSDVSEPEDPNNEDSSALSDASMEKEPQKKARNKAHKIDSAERSTPETIETEKHEGNAAPDHAKSESEMSEVMDEDPKPKPRKRRSAPGEGKTKTVAKPKEKKSKPQDTNPDGEEIKRLQGWLVKCGIRKMWYRELAPYDNPKAKIRHLKEMLADAGMIGRYSAEKATQIREARELKSELEAVQAGAKQWGTGGSDGEDDAKPKRRLARGLQNLDFLNDDDGAESD